MEPATADAAIVSTPIGQRVARVYGNLTDGQRRAADFLLGRPFDAATMGIEEFAAAAQVSTATANRFARSLGFPRYADFRSDIVETFRPGRMQEEKLSTARRGASVSATIAASLDEDTANLSRTTAALSLREAEAAAALIVKATRIFTVGFGTSSYLASYAANLLDPIAADTRFVAAEGGTEQAARRLVKLKPGQVVIAITLPRYSRDIVDVVRLAKARGARVLAITDRPSSPISPFADIALYGFAERRILSSSAVATLALIEALTSAVACRRKGAVAAMRALTEQVQPYLDDSGPAPNAKNHNQTKNQNKRKNGRI
jgi:DNA-binding MurR/RpiR family transcriptional regulator